MIVATLRQGRGGRRTLTALMIVAVTFVASPASAQQRRVRDICRVKGQEQNSLRGVGLVVGLNGTGDPKLQATTRALARMLSNTGISIPRGLDGQDLVSELEDIKNVAMVFISATVPAAGARQGDKLECKVHAWGNAKSLEGGQLLMSPMLGGRPTDDPTKQRIYAYAQGAVHIENKSMPLNGRIQGGCQLEVSFNNTFAKDGAITLVLDKDHADFRTAQDIAELINNWPDFRYADGNGGQDKIAHAIDQVNIEVQVLDKYLDNPVPFVSQMLQLPITGLTKGARVVIYERSGTVVIGENVVIDAVAVSHGGFNVEAGPFFPLNTTGDTLSAKTGKQVKLKSLVEALNALEAPKQDIIAIIKALKRNGALYGELIIE